MKIFLKYFFRIVFGLLGIIVLYFMVAIVLSYIPSDMEAVAGEKNQTFYLQSNGTHLDIVLPVPAIDSVLLRKLQIPENTKYVSFGWGNKEFYFNVPEWKDLSIGLAFRAVFMQLEAAQHVRYLKRKKEDWTIVYVAPSQLKQLNDFIQNSFVEKENSFVQCKCSGYSDNDCFYDAKGNYSCINTCNVWVNDALKEASVNTSVWSPFHFGVLHHLEE